MVLELDIVGWRQGMRDQDDGAFLWLKRRLARMPEQGLYDAFDHLHHVLLTFAQILILDLLELRHYIFHLLFDRPFGIAEFAADNVLGFLGERPVSQDHQMRADNSAQLGRRGSGQLRADIFEVLPDRLLCYFQAGDFLLYGLFVNLVIRALTHLWRNQ